MADGFALAADALAAEHGAVVTTIDDIKANAAVDAVVICTLTNTHADLIEGFAIAVKAVFC